MAQLSFDAVFEHAGVAEQPGEHGDQVGFAEASADGAVDRIVEHDGVGRGDSGWWMESQVRSRPSGLSST